MPTTIADMHEALVHKMLVSGLFFFYLLYKNKKRKSNFINKVKNEFC